MAAATDAGAASEEEAEEDEEEEGGHASWIRQPVHFNGSSCTCTNWVAGACHAGAGLDVGDRRVSRMHSRTSRRNRRTHIGFSRRRSTASMPSTWRILSFSLTSPRTSRT